jgi:hypothetical protein
MPNAIHTILCYWTGSTWAFDDAARGIIREPFVSGADSILTLAALRAGVQDPRTNGFTLTFSEQPFPGFQACAARGLPEHSGFWYTSMGVDGWLCPALFKFFEAAPLHIYFMVKEATR